MAVRAVDDMLVHFVGNDKGVVFLCQIRDEFELRAAEDFSGRIGGIAQNDGFGTLSKGGAQLRRVVNKIGRMQWYVDGPGAA